MNDRQIELGRHALGLPNRKNESYRNHFVAGPGHDDYEEWQKMVAEGNAVRRAPTELSGGDDVFFLTLKGALACRKKREHLSPEDCRTMRSMELEDTSHA